jgi:hypothetical protein
MGSLSYNGTYNAEFDDRVLAHLQVVIGAKLRRGESFHFSWSNERSPSSGRASIWLHPSIPIVYRYDGAKQPTINRVWLDDLMTSANSVAGLQLVPETADLPKGADPSRGAARAIAED